MSLSQENTKKRERSANFGYAEVQLLTTLIGKHKTVIENKKTDAVTNQDKERAWQKIASAFNAASGSTTRSAKTLKLKYEGLKKNTKKKAAAQRQEMYKTGGGVPDMKVFTDVEEKVLGICSNINGLPARFDSDTIQASTPLPDQTLQQLECSPDDTMIEVIIQQEVDVDEIDVRTPGTEEEASDMKIPDTEEQQKEKNLPAYDWSSWNPTSLKLKKSKPLKVTKDQMSEKMSAVATARLELLSVQLEVAKTELKCKEQMMEQQRLEHKAKMQAIQYEIELLQVKLAKENGGY